MPFVNVDPKLGNQRVSKGELRQGISSNCELADAYDPHTKLGQGKDHTVTHKYARNYPVKT
jgi:hypothetical protein